MRALYSLLLLAPLAGAQTISIMPDASFHGWTRLAFPPGGKLDPASQWKVENGVIVCAGDRGHEWLRYDRELADFVFEVGWRFSKIEGGKGYNSGVFVRNSADGALWHQAQAGSASGGWLFGNTLVNGVAQRVNLRGEMKENRVKEAGEWNRYEIRAQGPRITLSVNGAVTSEFTRCEVPKGYIGLEAEGYRIEFRNLKLTVLEAPVAHFAADRIDALRRKAAAARQVPEQGPQGWSRSTVDPARLLAAFPELRLNSGYVLRAYQYRAGGNGNGLVYALPSDAPFPDPVQAEADSRPRPPAGALEDAMQAISGDGTPWSYLAASLFARELRDFGAMWHGVWWGTHQVIDRNPLLGGVIDHGPFSQDPKQWSWIEPAPADYRPSVRTTSEGVEVVLYTYSGLVNQAIYRHRDRYAPGRYAPKLDVKLIAKGPGGYFF